MTYYTASFGNVFDADSTKELDSPINPWTHFSYGSLCKRSGIAKGIESVYAQLLKKLNITCRIIDGTVDDDGMMVSHSWCMVKIKNDWHFSDPTYGINGSGVELTGFLFDNRTASGMYDWDHIRYPACPSCALSYADVEKYVSAHLPDLISYNIDETYLTLPV